MYIVHLDGSVLHNHEFKDYQIVNASVAREVNKTSTFFFTIYPSHPLYNSIQKLKSIIEVFDDGELIFRGRPLNDTIGIFRNVTIECEGELAYLNDSLMHPYEFTGSVTDLIKMYIAIHNSQVDSSRQFEVGSVSVTDGNDYIVRSKNEYTKMWDEISDKTFKSSLGGYLMLRRENGVNFIDYLQDSFSISGQSIEITKNILDYNQETRSEDILTVLVPLGAKIKDEEGNETDERLTIAAVNNDSLYVEHAQAISKYGRIVGFKIWDDVTDANNLKNKAIIELNFLVNLGLSISIKAIDLNLVDKSISKVRFFSYVNIKSDPHGVEDEMLIKKQTIYLDKPENNTIEVGVEYASFIDKQLEMDKAIKIINSDYVTNQQVASIVSSIQTKISEITQTADRIELNILDLRDYTDGRIDEQSTQIQQTSTQIQQEIIDRQMQGERIMQETSSSVSQLSDSLTLQFTRIDGSIGEVTGDLKELKTYFKFDENGVIIGKNGSPVTLNLVNDRIEFRENGVAFAYWEGGTMSVDNIIAEISVLIGTHLVTHYDSPVVGASTLVRQVN